MTWIRSLTVDVTIGAVKLATYIPGPVMTGKLKVPPAEEARVRLAPETGPVLFLTVMVRFETIADLKTTGLAPSVTVSGGMTVPSA
jgi:hypothetical protein